MDFNEFQKEYIKKQLSINKGSQTIISKSDILEFGKSLGLEIKKNCSKETALELIYSTGNEDKLFKEFAHLIDVPYWDAAKLNGLTYKQLSDLEQYELIKRLEYTGWKDSTLYPLSVLAFDEGQLLKIWNDKNKTDFHRTRIDIKSNDEIEPIINQLSKVFEVENVSKPYPHREFEGYYIYLSIRSLNAAVTNDNYKNSENAKLKLENSTLRGKIKDLESKISDLDFDSRNSESYKDLNKRLTEYHDKYLELKGCDYKVERLENEITELKEKLKAISGGRPQKFTDQDKETMKMYRLQGKSIRYIAKAFECSTGLVHKIVSEE
jgi:hypothetical protein